MQFNKQLVDSFGRKITYVRFSITPRCNFDCFYCTFKQPQNTVNTEFTIEDMDFLFFALKKIGINKLRITGGEPLIREDVVEIVQSANSRGIGEIVLTTNGFKLKELALKLRESGLERVNVSLDTLRPEVFKQITGVDAFKEVYDGIFESLKVGLAPVKINTVLLNGINNDDLIGLARLTVDYPLIVRFIELMPTSGSNAFKEHFLSFKSAFAIVNSEYDLAKLADENGEVATYYKVTNAKGKIGFISSVSQHFCASCNRIRITAKGRIYPCLFSPVNVDIFEAVRSRKLELLLEKISEAVAIKPASHSLINKDGNVSISNMRELGG